MASKHLWLTKVTANDSTAREEIGAVRREWNSTDGCFKVYKYVQASLTAAGSNGRALSWYGTSSTVKGTIATDSTSMISANLPAGVCVGTLTDQYYGWIQIGGYHSAVDTSGTDDIAAGDWIGLSGATDGTVTRGASGTASSVKIIGVAVADDVDANDTVAAMLDCKYGDVMATKNLWNTPLSSNTSTKKEELGSIRREFDRTDNCMKTYKYVQASVLSAGGNGTPLLYYDVLGHVVTDDISTTKQGLPAGVCIGALTTTYYGWIQIGGYKSSICTDGTAITVGQTIIYDTLDRKVDAVAVGTATTHKPLAIGSSSVNATQTSGLLCCDYGDIAQ